MNCNQTCKWMIAHGFILFFFFSFFLVGRSSPSGLAKPLLVPSSVMESTVGQRLISPLLGVGNDQWIYYHISQYILRGNLSPEFARYKARNEGSAPSIEYKTVRLPYRDLSFEYPPLALIPVLIPALFTNDLYFYRIGFSFLASTAYLLTLWVFLKIYRDLPREAFPEANLKTVWLSSFLFLLFMGPIVVYRLDIFATLCAIGALRALQKENPISAGVFLSLGVATKLYPLILFPLFGVYLLREHTLKSLWKFAASFAATLLVIYLPVLLFTGEAYLNSLGYHSRRGVEFESLYASWAQIGSLIFGISAQMYPKFGSNNLHWSGEEWVIKYWSWIALIAMALVYFQYSMKPRQTGGTGQKGLFGLIQSSFLVILALLLTSKVFSPQYLLWLFPLFLIVGSRKKFVFPLLLQAALASLMIYPFLFPSLDLLDPFAVGVLAWRNLLLLILFFLLMDWGLIFQGIRTSVRKT